MVLFVGISLCQGEAIFSQAVETGVQSNEVTAVDEEQGPMIFKFEPDYLLTVEDRKQQILRYRAIIDTMNISERKRRALLKDLYKNGHTARFSKALLADTKFEDIE
ncbi:MAG: hypothetical protein WBN39_10020 [Flavobacteriaceae bacterium]